MSETDSKICSDIRFQLMMKLYSSPVEERRRHALMSYCIYWLPDDGRVRLISPGIITKNLGPEAWLPTAPFLASSLCAGRGQVITAVHGRMGSRPKARSGLLGLQGGSSYIYDDPVRSTVRYMVYGASHQKSLSRRGPSWDCRCAVSV